MEFLGTVAAAEYVGLSTRSFRRAVSAGLIAFDLHPFGGRKFRTVDLDAYLKTTRVHPSIKRPAAPRVRRLAPPHLTALALKLARKELSRR